MTSGQSVVINPAEARAGDGREGDLQQQWARVRGRLREEYGDAAFRSWLKPLTFCGLAEGGKVRIAVQTKFMRDWVAAQYADRIRALWSGENPAVTSVEILVAPAGGV